MDLKNKKSIKQNRNTSPCSIALNITNLCSIAHNALSPSRAALLAKARRRCGPIARRSKDASATANQARQPTLIRRCVAPTRPFENIFYSEYGWHLSESRLKRATLRHTASHKHEMVARIRQTTGR
jgi:hypothetical protein